MLYRFKKAFLLAGLTSVIVMALVFVVAKAGPSLAPPAGPIGTTMNSLLEVYNVLAGTNTVVTSANINGNVLEQLKYISGMTLQQIYANSGATPTITGSSANAILTLQQTGAGNIFDLRNGTGSVFSISNAGLISGASGQIKAATGSTFYNEGGYAIAAAGEEILRASIPIFGYDFPARYANSTAAIKISRDITLDANSFPVLPAGANRRYKFKIQYANDAVNVNTSLWEIYAFPVPPPTLPAVLFDALDVVPNTGIASLDETRVYYSEAITTLPANGVKWHLQVTAPAGTIIQIYQIELLAYDVPQAGP